MIFGSAFAQSPKQCEVSDQFLENVIAQIRAGNKTIIKSLNNCFKVNRNLILKATLADLDQFQYADNVLKEDEIFVNRILKVYPDVLQYVSPKLLSSERFMQNATYIHRDSLKYAVPELKDNKIFMTKMITIDSRNYIFASPRLREDEKIAEIAFSDDGLLIEFAPQKIKDNFNLAKMAVNSNSQAIEFISDELKNNQEIKSLIQQGISPEEIANLKKFLEENYTETESQKGLAVNIVNRAKFFEKNIFAQRNFVTKWHRMKKMSYDDNRENLTLIDVESRNYPVSWRQDFKNYPLLSDKVTNFFKKHNIDDSTIDNLRTTFFWLVKSNLPTVAFNIYGLRESKDSALGPEFADVTSLTVIAQKQGDRWNMTVVEVIFSSEIKTNVAYSNGHKRYILWDLYQINENDNNPKIIFKVEDKFRDYFEVYEEQNGGKYNKILEYKFY